MALVSIIMNSHNGSKFLNRSIRSVLNQKYKKWELIFWDNCSVDDTKEKIKKINDKRIKYYYSSKFYSLYHSRNLAISKAKGKYICFLDVDDQWKKNKINFQLDKIKKTNYDIVFSNYSINDSLKKRLFNRVINKYVENCNITQELLDDYFLGIVTVMAKREIFSKFKFNKRYNIIGDFDFFIRLSLFKNFYFIKNSLAIYNIHKSNYSKKNLIQYIKELNYWLKKNEKNFLKKRYKLNYLKFYLMKLKVKYYLNNISTILGM